MGDDQLGEPRQVSPDVAERASAFVSSFVASAGSGVLGPACHDALRALSRAGAPEVEASTSLLDEALSRWGQAISNASAALARSQAVLGRSAEGGLVQALELTDSASDQLMLATAEAGLHLDEVVGRLSRVTAYETLCAAIASRAETVADDLQARGDPRASALLTGPVTTARERHRDLTEARLVLNQGVAALDLGQRGATELRSSLARARDMIATAASGATAATALTEVRDAIDGAVAQCSQVAKY